MLAQYEPTVKAAIVFLRLLGVKVNNGTVNETLQNHPDWPSLLCISDSFQKWNIPNAAGKISTEDIDLLPIPFLVRISDTDIALTVVTHITETHVSYYAYNYRKTITIKRNDFLEKWDGVYLIAEPHKESGEKDFYKIKRQLLLKASVPLGLLTLLFFFSFYKLLFTFKSNISVAILLQYVIYVAGVFVTALLLWYEIDRNNPLLKKSLYRHLKRQLRNHTYRRTGKIAGMVKLE